ncbi:MAG: NADH-quinone oxidoreductase subunit N, partial [Deltaproteobacteria bacterium]|nr:NADH-quinone oxidoreductase subunit N [Deltaproteobacteria bacterium]
MSALSAKPLAVPLVLALSSVVMLFLDTLLSPRLRHRLGACALGLLLVPLAASFWLSTPFEVAGGVYVSGPGTVYLQRIFLLCGVLCVLGGLEHVDRHARARQGEYYFLLFLSLLGMTVLAGARDFLLLIVCFELMGLPLYVLAAFGKNDGPVLRNGAIAVRGAAAEAGIKLYLTGAASTAVALFGLSLIVGTAGGTSLSTVAAAAPSPILLLGTMMVLAGMGFKIGVAPFHMWVPDTYQGAQAPFVAFLSSAPKVAGVAALCTVFFVGLPGAVDSFRPALVALAVLTMTVGTLLAVPQTSIKRLLAYSGVAHVGYLLMGVAAGTPLGMSVVLYYLAIYAVTNVGTFLVVHAVATEAGTDDLSAFSGLFRRAPGLALALLIFLLSLAGIPFMAGFWAKLYVFTAAFRAGMGWLVLIGALLSVVALF